MDRALPASKRLTLGNSRMSEHAMRPAKRHRHDQADGSGPVAMNDAGSGPGSGSSPAPAPVWGNATREAMLEDYKRHWKGAWDATRCLQTLSGHSKGVAAVAVLGADRIVSGSLDRTLKVWSLSSGECLQTLSGHLAPVRAVAVLDADRIVSSSCDMTLKMWSVTDRRRHMAALQINRHWRDAISNPERTLCRKWLARQCE